jgi:hypothetical protein
VPNISNILSKHTEHTKPFCAEDMHITDSHTTRSRGVAVFFSGWIERADRHFRSGTFDREGWKWLVEDGGGRVLKGGW